MTETRVAVVLTALDTEYDAVRRHLKDVEKYRHGAGTRFEIGTVDGTTCRIVLGLTGVGNHSAAVLAERAIQEFSPLVVLFAGVAGALRDKVDLGDVVVGSQVYAYHGGTSEDDGLKARPRGWEAPHGISQAAHEVARSGAWIRRLPPASGSPKVRFGPIAAGEIVQKSRISREAQWIREHYNDAMAIEMEAAGVAQAGHLNNAPVAIVRGISDRADDGKTSTNDGTWQPRAAANAAAFAIELAVELSSEAEVAGVASNKAQPEAGASRGNSGTVFNMATGTVGIQAANVSGSTVRIAAVSPGGGSVDPATAVAELRTLLDRHHAAGGVDEETYEAARDELDTAQAMLLDPQPVSRRKSALALKKFGGIMSDTADVAARATVAIAAVNGLS